MGGGLTIPRPQPYTPAPPATFQRMRCPHMACLDFIEPANLNKTGTGTWGPTTRAAGTADAFKLHYYRQLLPNYENTLPGSTCPGCSPMALAAPIPGPRATWRPWSKGLGELSWRCTPSRGIQGYHMVRVLKEDGKLKLTEGPDRLSRGPAFSTTVGQRQRTSITSQR